MDPQRQLDGCIDRFAPEIALLARDVLARMRRRLPGANLLVYDNYNALAIGLGPTERASDAIFSIAVFPRGVNLCLLQGGLSPIRDPGRRLRGSGTRNRYIPLESASELDQPDVEDLVSQALAAASVPLDPAAKGRLVIQSVSARQRPRRPGAA